MSSGIRRAWLSIIAVLCASIIVVSTGSSAQSSGALVVGFNTDYITLDFQRLLTPGTYSFGFPAYDRLVAMDRKGRVVPYLAKSWKVTPTSRPKQIVFTMKRPYARCEDGSPVTPHVVANSFKRFFDVQKITNQQSRYFGPGPFEFSANDRARTFTARSQTPFSNLLVGFTQAGLIVCPAGLKALASDPMALDEHQYGSGPYHLVSASHNSEVVWSKNANWTWGPPGSEIAKMPDTLTYRIVNDQTTMANLVLTGGVDMAPVSGPDVARLAASSTLQHRTTVNYHYFPIVFNQRPGRVTTELAVRRALMAAVNLNDVLKAGWPQGGVATPSILNPSVDCYDKTIGTLKPSGGVSGARQILQNAGWTAGSDGVFSKSGRRLRISFALTPTLTGSAGEYLAAQFKEAGFDVDFRPLPLTTFSAVYFAEDFDVLLSSSLQFLPLKGVNLPLYWGPKSVGFIGGPDQEYQRAALIAQQRTDCAPWIKLQRLILQKAVMLPLVQPIQHIFGNKNWDFPANFVPLEIADVRRN